MTEAEKKQAREALDALETEAAQALFNIGRKESFVREARVQIEKLHSRVDELNNQAARLRAEMEQ